MRQAGYAVAGLIGAAICFLLTSAGNHRANAEQAIVHAQDRVDLGPFVTTVPGGVTLTVDDTNAKECYFNAVLGQPGFRGEIIIDLGYVRPDVRAGTKGMDQPILKVSTRLIMQRRAAELLANSLKEQIANVAQGEKATTEPSR